MTLMSDSNGKKVVVDLTCDGPPAKRARECPAGGGAGGSDDARFEQIISANHEKFKELASASSKLEVINNSLDIKNLMISGRRASPQDPVFSLVPEMGMLRDAARTALETETELKNLRAAHCLLNMEYERLRAEHAPADKRT